MDQNVFTNITPLSFSFSGQFSFYRHIFLASIFINLFVLAMPLFTMSVYDRVLSDFDEPTLIVLTIGVLIALLFDFVLKMIRSSYLNTLSSVLSKKQEASLMEQFLCSYPQADMSVGKGLALFKELANIRMFWTTRLLAFFFDAPFFIIFIAVIYMLSPALATIPLLGAGIIILSGLTYAFFSTFLAQTKKELLQKKSNVLLETLNGLETIQSLNAKNERLNLWNSILIDEELAQKPEQFFQALLSNFSVFINLGISVLVLFTGVYEIAANNLTMGGLIAISILSSRCLAPIIALSPVFGGLKQYQNSRMQVQKLLHNIEIKDTPSLSDKTDITGKIKLDHVSFSYAHQSNKAVKDVCVEIPAGAKYGLIGKSGAGKTTLVKLLSGHLTPQSGKILWDHYHLEAISQEQRAGCLSFASQEDRFFAGTIADNVFMGDNSNYRDQKENIERAAFISGLDLVMQQSGFGWDTPVGEGGMGLSIGQRQSLSLARALIKDPKILVFDEPLSGMDYALEMRLKEHLPAYLQGRTLIIITHRTTLLPLVDHLILMENGQIKASGKREEMMKALV